MTVVCLFYYPFQRTVLDFVGFLSCTIFFYQLYIFSISLLFCSYLYFLFSSILSNFPCCFFLYLLNLAIIHFYHSFLLLLLLLIENFKYKQKQKEYYNGTLCTHQSTSTMFNSWPILWWPVPTLDYFEANFDIIYIHV